MEVLVPRTPEEWDAVAHEAYDEYLKALKRFGVSVDPELRFLTGTSPESYYEAETMSVRIGMADPAKVSGRLYWAFLANLMGLEKIDDAVEVMGRQLPLIVVHEVTHHLRHRYGAPIQNDFIEEQVVNTISLAFVAQHPRYAHIVPLVQELAGRATPKLARLAPQAAAARMGFRTDLGDVLLERGLLDRRTLESLRQLAEELDLPLDEVLDRADAATDAELEEAREVREEAEAYFNRRYMLDPSEYNGFHTDWFRNYLARADYPDFSEAVERYILSEDWERTRAEEQRAFLVACLDDPSDHLAAAAVEALIADGDPSAVEAVERASEKRPALRAAAAPSAPRAPRARDALEEALLANDEHQLRGLVDGFAEIASEMASRDDEPELLTEARHQARAAALHCLLSAAAALGDPAQGALADAAMRATDPAARERGRALALDAAPPDLRPRLAELLEGSTAAPAVDPASLPALQALVEDLDAAMTSESLTQPTSEALTTVEKLVFLRATPLFSTVPLAALHAVADEFVLQKYEPGEVVFDLGQDDHRLYVITAGAVRIDQDAPGGARRTIAQLAPAQSFGETGLLTDEARSAIATAAAPTATLTLDRERFVELGHRHPEVLLEVMRTLAKLLRDADRDIG